MTERASYGGFKDLDLSTHYRSGSSNVVSEFYRAGLSRAITYDRASGYFRSTVFKLIGNSLVEFAKRGGLMRLVCSPALYDDDIDAIEKGYVERKQLISAAVYRELDTVERLGSGLERLSVLATLIKTKHLDIRIAIPKAGGGIYHEKLGILSDDMGNRVSFIGSSNETFSGWDSEGNFESIEVFGDWLGTRERQRVLEHERIFETLWNGTAAGVSVCELPDNIKQYIESFGYSSVKMLEYGSISDRDDGRSPSVNNSGRQPMRHQIEALESWERNGFRGILQHATGSGKTFTAILAVKRHIEAGGAVLIVVPSKILIDQWKDELKYECPDSAILQAGGGADRWKKNGRLRSFSRSESGGEGNIILATLHTAAKSNFREQLVKSGRLLMVVDEVHKSGSVKFSDLYTIDAGYRLGLSATPERFGDSDGTNKLMNYFGGVLEPVVSLEGAIKLGRLVNYEYSPHRVSLIEEEATEWSDLTRQIQVEYAKAIQGNGNENKMEYVKRLAIARSRIAKKATNKIYLAERVINKCYKEGQKWLIYCEDRSQLEEVLERLKINGYQAVEYYSDMLGDRQAALDWYRNVGGILVSIRCLDEGVDIPDITHALILASSQNPREFIQRRGRILRKSEGKYVAYLHDALVLPPTIEEEPDQASLVQGELSRALEFAGSALNSSAAAKIRRMAIDLGLDPDQVRNYGFEEDS